MKNNNLYNIYKLSFINELYKRKGVVANTDIDGILSAALLCNLFPHLSILGFTNSCTNIYLSDNIKKNDVLLTKELKIKLQEIYDSNQLIRNAKCTDLEKLWDYKIRRSTIYYKGKQLQVIKII